MLKRIWKVALLSLRRWLSEGKTLFGIFLLGFFSFLTYTHLNEVVSFFGVKASPWVFSFLTTQTTMILVVAGITILMFSDIFTVDEYDMLMVAHSSRVIYIWGQMVFVLIGSLLVTTIAFIFSILFTVSSIAWETGWGKVIHTIADQPQLIMDRTGLELYISINTAYISTVDAIPSTLFSIFLLWLYMLFTALLIGCFRILKGNMTGIIISGFLTFLSVFAMNLGLLSYGAVLRYLAPLLWCAPVHLNWYGITGLPTFGYAVTIYGLSILLMVIASVVRFQHGDIRETIGG